MFESVMLLQTYKSHVRYVHMTNFILLFRCLVQILNPKPNILFYHFESGLLKTYLTDIIIHIQISVFKMMITYMQ